MRPWGTNTGKETLKISKAERTNVHYRLDHFGPHCRMGREQDSRRNGQGFFLDLALGIVGALVGGFLYSGIFGGVGISGVNIGSIIVAIIGSIIVLLVYHALTGLRTI
jgi:uncharacterized membrane protein YeaQ/YmgE (transglycosylase-associated protein family)